MGLIRTLLALCVVLYHSYSIFGCKFTGGRVSVQCFYIISGFYMALILSEKCSSGNFSWKKFMSSRLTRLLPLYFFMVLLSFAISLLGYSLWNNPYYLGNYIAYWNKMDGFARFFIVFENVFLMGTDLLFFLKLNLSAGNLSFTTDPFLNKPLLNSFTFVPQAWTLSIEICFYALAPFFVRLKKYWLLLLIAVSLTFRWWLFHWMGLYFDPWTYRFFPTELAFFISGILLFSVYEKIKDINWARTVGQVSFALIIVLVLFYNQTETGGQEKSVFNTQYRHWFFYGIFALCLPFIFHLSRNSKADRMIGEFSFPVYLCHHLVAMLLRPWFFKHTQFMSWYGVCTLVISLLFAYVCLRYLVWPVDKWRRLQTA